MRIFNLSIPAFLLIAAPLAFAAPAHAQTAQDKFEVSFQARETQRRATISSTMRFDEKEAEQFWPIYDQYRLAAKSHQLKRLKMIARLAETGVDMDAATAREISSNALALETEQQSAKAKYISGLSPHFTGARYFRLYQLETKLDAIFRFGWTKGIPLAVTEEEQKLLQGAFDAKMEAEKQATAPTT